MDGALFLKCGGLVWLLLDQNIFLLDLNVLVGFIVFIVDVVVNIVSVDFVDAPLNISDEFLVVEHFLQISEEINYFFAGSMDAGRSLDLLKSLGLPQKQ